jgi:filamentous hemagglutinin
MVHGRNLPFTFQTIDKFANGIATSIKSINLNAPSYRQAKALYGKLREQINEVANFTGKKWAGVIIGEDQIAGRTLDVVVPHSGNVAQKSAIKQAVEYGA